MEYALELSGVCKHYSDFSLQNVSFRLPKGSIMGFIGENGAGKTTTIKTILNLIHPDGGEIRILGRDSRKEEPQARAETGVVLDTCCFYPTLRVRQINRILKQIYPTWDEALFFSYTSRFQLPAAKPVKDFSKGMRMKLNIACALAHRPKLLLLDEATSGLDPVMRDQFLDLLLEFIQEEDHSVLFSTHITSDLEKVADYITFLQQGRIVFSEAKDVLTERYGILRCSKEAYAKLDRRSVAGCRQNAFGVEALITNKPEFTFLHRELTVDPVSVEDIMVYYGKENQ